MNADQSVLIAHFNIQAGLGFAAVYLHKLYAMKRNVVKQVRKYYNYVFRID